ncbi:hypothetical protein [Marinomonas foliarum]|uniref:Uncharacterized protein n=1 Tax=Marinomonas foliarum TaxID=491950 RepID=A0A368ZW44_9GAMM|nr:hypothetical protein [Marinomonas foliarum]RCX01230.1 hypothetical protein DFP77_1174 [Marinomonas foliarum]
MEYSIPPLGKLFISLLLFLCFLSLALSIMALLQGDLVAILPVAVNSAVIFGYFRRTTWLSTAIKFYSAMLILSGSMMWLSYFIGGELPEQSVDIIRRSVIALLGLFFISYVNTFVKHLNLGADEK